MADLSQQIEDAAKSPKRAQDDAGSVEARSIDELIKAEEHLSGKDAASKKHRGLRITLMTPPGAV